MKATTPKILVIDDDPRLRDLLVRYLSEQGFSVQALPDARDLDKKLQRDPPHLLVLDLMLPGEDGLAVCRRLRGSGETVPVIMLTAKGEEVDRIVGLELGADDYIVKPFSQRELLARIRAALRRTIVAEGEVVTVGQLKLDAASHQVSVEGAEIPLGPTEYRLLEFFMHHPDRVYSRAQLLDRVWGGNVYVEERTVDVHIRRLRKALTPYGYDRLIRTVRGAGYRFSPGQT
jgi:two-component system phosphate regulon response regulator PhoB